MHVNNIDDQETQTLLDTLAAFNLTEHVRFQHTTKAIPWT